LITGALLVRVSNYETEFNHASQLYK